MLSQHLSGNRIKGIGFDIKKGTLWWFLVTSTTYFVGNPCYFQFERHFYEENHHSILMPMPFPSLFPCHFYSHAHVISILMHMSLTPFPSSCPCPSPSCHFHPCVCAVCVCTFLFLQQIDHFTLHWALLSPQKLNQLLQNLITVICLFSFPKFLFNNTLYYYNFVQGGTV